MDGQLLAQEFVAPHIISNDYDLFVDVHSNKGTVSGTYEETNFVFAVGKDEKSEVFVGYTQVIDTKEKPKEEIKPKKKKATKKSKK